MTTNSRDKLCGAWLGSPARQALAVTTMMLLGALLVQAALGQPPRRRPPGVRGRPPTKEDQEEKKEEPKKEERKKDEKITAIVGADIYTVSREVIRRGTVLIQGDKILEVGQNIKVPDKATVIDASGKYITPGFVAMSMSRIGTQFSSRSSSAKLADSLDPFDRDIKLALGVGITSGCVQISSSSRGFFRRNPDQRFLGLEPEFPVIDDPNFNPDFGELEELDTCACCGLPVLPTEPITPSRPSAITPRKYAVLKMSFGELAPMLVTESPFYALTSSSLAGSLNRHTWRKSIVGARKYLKDREEHEKAIKAGKKVRPPRKTASDDLIKLVKGETYLRVQADSAEDIRDMVALAKELDYKLMIDGAIEGWVTTEELSEHGVPAIITPRSRRSATRGKEDSSGSTIELSSKLEAAGVPFAVSTLSSSISLNGLAGRDLTSLPLEAAFAVRGGCSERAALASLTIVPAQMIGMSDRIGSIDKGKDADLLILSGPPLDYRSYVDVALVAGKIRYDRAKDQVYPVFERAELRQ